MPFYEVTFERVVRQHSSTTVFADSPDEARTKAVAPKHDWEVIETKDGPHASSIRLEPDEDPARWSDDRIWAA